MRTTVLTHFHTFHPDAQARFNALKDEEARIRLEQARRSDLAAADDPPKKRRMSEKLDVRTEADLDADLERVRAAMDEQRKVIASGVVRIIIKGLSRGEFRRLLIAHPPREDDPLDVRLGYNADTFGDEFIQACIVRCEDHDGGTVPNEWGEWADEMTNGQWEEVFRACLALTNDGEPAFPR